MKPSKASTESPQALVQLPTSPLKPIDSSPHEAHVLPPSFYYEPTSVLDPNLTSSPGCGGAGGGGGGGQDLPTLPWDVPPTLLPDDWDSVASWLSDDFAPPAKLVDDPPPSLPDPFEYLTYELGFQVPGATPQVFERGHLELLVQAAQAVESRDYSSAHLILARLNPCLPAPISAPIQRAAFYFKEALQSLLLRSPVLEASLSAAELVRRIAAYKEFSDLSPIPQFVSFTANQALLEAFPAEAPVLHVIDFDLGFGGQWSSFVQELAARSRATRRSPPRVRLTAVVQEGDSCATEARLAADNLRDFAAGLGLRLSVDVVRLGALALGAVRLSAAEPSGVVLSSTVLGSSPESSAAVLRFVRGASPRVVVFVDTDCGSATSPPSFRRSFVGGLEHYTAVLESLDAAAAAAGLGEEPVRRVERALVRPKVSSAVGAWAGSAGPEPWCDFFAGAGWVPAPVSEFAESQAEWLLQRSPIVGFEVERREGSLVLSWRGREVAATSVWRW